MRISRSLTFALTVALLWLSLGALPQVQAQTNQRCFNETNACIQGRFLQFWEQHGGLPVFGFPLGNETTEGGYTVQYFERQRFEFHPENAAPYDVLLGRLGAEILARNGIDWQTQPTSPGAAAGCRWFPETQHNVCDQQVGNGFLTAWSSHGLEFDGQRGTSYAESLALFGMPITEAYETTINGQTVQVMWFERARFEWHPNNEPTYRVLFGRLGAELHGEPVSAPLPGNQSPPSVPLLDTTWQLVSYGAVANQQAAVADRAATMRLGADGRLSGNSGCNGFGGAYTVTADTITFSEVLSTLIACEEPLNQQEREIFAALQGTNRYTLNSDMLQIYYNQDASMLTFKAQQPQTATVTGSVTYRERIALPSSAVVTVQLLDISVQDAPATVLAEQVINANGQQVPFSFSLTYDTSRIMPNGTYSVRATIRDGDQLLFTTTETYLVITQGNPTNVEIVLQRA
jgi:uncharacterized lipoprotein YbaY